MLSSYLATHNSTREISFTGVRVCIYMGIPLHSMGCLLGNGQIAIGTILARHALGKFHSVG
jgi:hypothetical protein